MTEEQVKHMVDRFLGWRLPSGFSPDAGISYTRPDYPPSWGPTGTNLLDGMRAEAMVRHLIGGLPLASNARPYDPATDSPEAKRAHVIDRLRYWLGSIDTRDPDLHRVLLERNMIVASIDGGHTPFRPDGAFPEDAYPKPPASDGGAPADDDADHYKLTGAQAVIAQSYRSVLAHLGIQVSVALKMAGLEDHKAMNVPVGEMIRTASIIAVAIARRELKREPNPALWRKTTDQIFAEVVDLVNAEPEPDPIDLLREARDYVYAAGDDNSAALLAEIDAALEAA